MLDENKKKKHSVLVVLHVNEAESASKENDLLKAIEVKTDENNAKIKN